MRVAEQRLARGAVWAGWAVMNGPISVSPARPPRVSPLRWSQRATPWLPLRRRPGRAGRARISGRAQGPAGPGLAWSLGGGAGHERRPHDQLRATALRACGPRLAPLQGRPRRHGVVGLVAAFVLLMLAAALGWWPATGNADRRARRAADLHGPGEEGSEAPFPADRPERRHLGGRPARAALCRMGRAGSSKVPDRAGGQTRPCPSAATASAATCWPRPSSTRRSRYSSAWPRRWWTLIGTVLGALAGFFGGRIGDFLEWLYNVFTSIPASC